MAYTAPGTAVAGEVLTASFWNQQVRDNMEAVAGAPFARNILYNGAMQIAQRNTSVASITTGGYYTGDRWNIDLSSLGTWTQSIVADAPSGSGLRKSLKMLCTTSDASPAASDYAFFSQLLEGQDLQRICKGTTSALALTLSFWVKSNKTGTYIAELFDIDNTRQVSASYTIDAVDTWQKKVIVFPADTTGAFDNDNAASLIVNFGLAMGSDRTSGTLNTTWASNVNANRYPGQTNLAAAINNYWQVTGVQLEVGNAATSFEFLPISEDFRRCQRYFCTTFPFNVAPVNGYTNSSTYNLNAYEANTGRCDVFLPTQMRVAPSITFYNSSTAGSGGLWGYFITSWNTSTHTTAVEISQQKVTVAMGISSSAYRAHLAVGYLTASAEL